VEGTPGATPAPPAEGENAAGPSNTPTTEKPEAKAEEDKAPKIETPAADGDVKMEVTTPHPAEGDAAGTPAPAQPVSIASKLPVHAWQYDELVFSDPPLAFLNILNANPPTPLPAKNRRPRDQREQVTGNKKKKGRVSEVMRSVTAEEAEGDVIVAAAVGVMGEAGSADVPLEFSAEMEKGEWSKLQDARKKIVDEMDRWR
jgi:YEATS domain-containing protein 4